MTRGSIQLEVAADWQKIHPSLWLNCWSQIDRRARMLVTPERVFLCGDEHAHAAIASEEDLRLRGLRVEPVDPSELPKFEQLLNVQKGEVRTKCLKTRGKDDHLLMRASVLASLSGMPLVGVSFHKTGASFSPAWVDLDDVFNLTSSESRIVSMLLAGSSAESIAEQLKLSINTVRTHIKHAYEKLDVCSREELWRRLAPYRLT